jgi:hypothetical protein
VLNPVVVVGEGLCGDTPHTLEVRETGTNREITTDPDVSYEWIGSGPVAAVLEAALKRVTDRLGLPTIQKASISVADGKVTFDAGQKGVGFNVLRAKRATVGEEKTSNIALVIGGLKLLKAKSLTLEPTSVANATPNVVADLMTQTLGLQFPDPPMILFAEGPCNDLASDIGRTGVIGVKELKFDLFGGLDKDADLIAAIEAGIGAIPAAGTIAKLGLSLGAKALPLVAAQLVDFEVSSEAAKSAQNGQAAHVTEDNVISVTDQWSTTFPFFSGVVRAKNPGLSAVEGTLDLGKCVGKANDSLVVWVAPRVESVEVRNSEGRYEYPLRVPLQGDRQARVVAMFNAFRGGAEPVEIPFDLLSLLPEEVGEIKDMIENYVPGGEDIIAAAGIPIEYTYPNDATLDPQSKLYRGGDTYFHLRFTYNPLQASITIEELQTQVPLPNGPVLTAWSVPVPPNPTNPAATVDVDTGLITGTHSGDGEMLVDVCLPFATPEFTFDWHPVRVTGDAMLVTGVVYDDRNGNRMLDTGEPGLSGWTVEVLSGIGIVLASGTSGGDGSYSFDVEQEQLPIGLNTFGVRERAPTGWTPTDPANAEYVGIPIALGGVVVKDFGNFRDVRVTGVKFADEDGNGNQDAGEPPLYGWTIEFVSGGGAVRQATTDGEGRYSFVVPYDQLIGAAAPLVREVQQTGWTPSFPPGGSQAVGELGTRLFSGTTLEVNFGNYLVPPSPTRSWTPTETPTPTRTPTDTKTVTPTATGSPEPSVTPTVTRSPVAVIAGTVFEDSNANERRDPEERVLPGWAVFLDEDGDRVLANPTRGNGICDGNARERCMHADGAGNYAFTVYSTGVYTVVEVLRNGWAQTRVPPDVVIDRPGLSIGDVDFGNRRTVLARAAADCNGDDVVTVDEIIRGVNIALGTTSLDECPEVDASEDGEVTVDELLKAVNNALFGIPTPVPRSPTPTTPETVTRTPIATPTASATVTRAPVPTATRTPVPTPTVTRTVTGAGTPTPTATPAIGAGVYCANVPALLAIPDNSEQGLTHTLTVGDVRTITDLNVRLDVQHPWVGDLVVTLTHAEPDAGVTLVDRPGHLSTTFGCGGDDISATFDDEAATAAEDACALTVPALGGRLRPSEALSRFDGSSAQGTWRLTVADHGAGDTGVLVGWCLEINVVPPVVSALTCNGTSECFIAVGQPITFQFGVDDRDGNAVGWRLTAEDESSETFDIAAGSLDAPTGNATITVPLATLRCGGTASPAGAYLVYASAYDTNGVASEPVAAFVLVFDAG